MRPNADITHSLNGRVKDLAEKHGVNLTEMYAQVIRRGVEEIEGEAVTESQDGLQADVDAIRDALDADALAELTDAEIEALAAMRAHVRDERVVSPKKFREDVMPDYPAHKENAKWWWQKLSGHVEDLPNVVKESQRRYVWEE